MIVEHRATTCQTAGPPPQAGTYTISRSFELQRQGGRWFVTAFTDQPLDFVPDPALDANLDVDPNPAATKQVPKEYVPVPVAP